MIEMTNKIKNIAVITAFAVIIIGLFIFGIIAPKKTISETERRPLASMPSADFDSLMSGNFTSRFENYATDNFPFRDSFRAVRSASLLYAFGQSDIDSVYTENGFISKLNYPINYNSIDHVTDRFSYIYNQYLKDTDNEIYLCVIPDKNRYMAQQNAYPSIDYEKFAELIRTGCDFAKYIDISDTLSLDDYYKTDSHLRQEKIVDTAQRLASSMGKSISAEYTQNFVSKPFYGVFYGQLALPLSPDSICCLTNDEIDSCTVYDHETSKTTTIYDMEKSAGLDLYEIFLSGAKSYLTIKNPTAKNNDRLIIFRDSFASSIAPLLCTGYSEVTLLDIRYILPEALGSMVDFSNSDVLFLYSTMVLNNSNTIK